MAFLYKANKAQLLSCVITISTVFATNYNIIWNLLQALRLKIITTKTLKLVTTLKKSGTKHNRKQNLIKSQQK